MEEVRRSRIDAKEMTTFWIRLWSENIKHNSVPRIHEVKEEFKDMKMEEDFVSILDNIQTGINKMINSKAAGQGLFHDFDEFLLKVLTNLHPKLQKSQEFCVHQGIVSAWMVK